MLGVLRVKLVMVQIFFNSFNSVLAYFHLDLFLFGTLLLSNWILSLINFLPRLIDFWLLLSLYIDYGFIFWILITWLLDLSLFFYLIPLRLYRFVILDFRIQFLLLILEFFLWGFRQSWLFLLGNFGLISLLILSLFRIIILSILISYSLIVPYLWILLLFRSLRYLNSFIFLALSWLSFSFYW